jgi:hypothetical protein
LTIDLSVNKVSEWRSMFGVNKLEAPNAAYQPALVSGVSVDCAAGKGMASPGRGFSGQTSRAVAMVTEYSAVSAAVALDINGNWETGFSSAVEAASPGRHAVDPFRAGIARLQVASPALAVNTKALTLGRTNATQMASKINGNAEVTAPALMPLLGSGASGVTINHYVKEDPGGSGYGMAARYYEIVICYGVELTALEISKLEGYLAHSTGTTGLLPGGHPYKTVPPYV